MRIIKFRAWDTEKKEMIYDGVCDKSDGWYGSENTYLHIHFDGSISGQISDDGGKNGLHEHDADIKKDRFILMQFTGLHDKNGKEIWEGDIIVAECYPWFDNDKPNYRSTVEWIYCQWQQVLHCVNTDKAGISDGINEGLNDEGYNETENSHWLIIGNIYENPELIGG